MGASGMKGGLETDLRRIAGLFECSNFVAQRAARSAFEIRPHALMYIRFVQPDLCMMSYTCDDIGHGRSLKGCAGKPALPTGQQRQA